MAKKELDHDAQDRKFMILVYEDTTDYQYEEILANICKYAPEWAYLRHDKDVEMVEDNGEEKEELKKPHYHVCVRFPTPRIRSTIAKQIGIKNKRHIERLRSWKAGNRYLPHLDDEDKYPYLPEDVVSNFEYFELIGEKRKEVDKMTDIVNFIKDNKIKRTTEVTEYCLQNDLWETYRRNFSIIKEYILENKYDLIQKDLEATQRKD